MPENEKPTVEMTEHGTLATVKTVQFAEAPPVPEVYANHIVPAITSFEVTLHFGTILEIGGDGTAKVARKVSVAMTPEVAKILMVQLSMGLANYEKNVRPIPIAKLIHNDQAQEFTKP